MPPEGTEFARCWAKSTSPCADGMSREHYVSRGIFPVEFVTVRGHSPLPENRRNIHIDDLVAKTLCRRHNRELDHLDQALIDFVNAMRETERLRRVRIPLGHKWHKTTRLVVDGPRIERCMLKMVMNYSMVRRQHLEGWRPPEWLPDVIFGKRALPNGCGLAMIVRVGDQLGDRSDSLCLRRIKSDFLAVRGAARVANGLASYMYLGARNPNPRRCSRVGRGNILERKPSVSSRTSQL
jgi:hypothetical protein